jgi:hypothetical protein
VFSSLSTHTCPPASISKINPACAFKYLEECLEEQPKKGTIENLLSLGVDRRYVIQSQMKKRGFDVYCNSNYDMSEVIVYPADFNLPIHIWRE